MTASVALSAGKAREERCASAVLQEHGAVLTRFCMALLGDSAATERAIERVAREAATTTFREGKELARLMGLARAACAQQLSNLPIRTASSVNAGNATPPAGSPAGDARAALATLKPTEREAVVLLIVGGLDVTQVAEACGIDLETARQRLARGIGQLVEGEKLP